MVSSSRGPKERPTYRVLRSRVGNRLHHPYVLMAYCDESGDTGWAKGASLTYSIGCVLVDVEDWPSAFNGLL